jgi:hypothetical protein
MTCDDLAWTMFVMKDVHSWQNSCTHPKGEGGNCRAFQHHGFFYHNKIVHEAVSSLSSWWLHSLHSQKGRLSTLHDGDNSSSSVCCKMKKQISGSSPYFSVHCTMTFFSFLFHDDEIILPSSSLNKWLAHQRRDRSMEAAHIFLLID